jgi:small subunit ribosomal protein S6
MRKYEVGLVISPELEEEALTALIEKVEQWITESGGEVLNVDHWGRRKLAYSIHKFTDGYYVFVTAEMEPHSVKTLEQNLNLSEAVLRYLTTRVEE